MNHTNRSSAKRLRLRHAVPSLMPAPGPVQRRAELPVAEGTLKQIDCMGGKIRMRIGVGAKVLSFALPDPGSIAIKDHAAMDFTCGPQRAAADQNRIRGERGNHAGNGGVVRSIEFPE